jgi:regulator of sirC expression with transglutaminase-like and TPR domain
VRDLVQPLLFRLLASRAEDQIDLGEAALLVAAAQQPELDVSGYVARLDGLGAEARARAASAEDIQGLLKFLFREKRFRGNADDYYDPRNSLLSEVLDRRTGIPITLAVVLLEVGRRAGVALEGVSFPGHFLVRSSGGKVARFIDPFEGKLLGQGEIHALARRAMGRSGELDPRWLEPATKKQILTRLLSNLRAIYGARAQRDRLLRVLEQMAQLAPTDDVLRELETLGGSSGWSAPRGPHAVH